MAEVWDTLGLLEPDVEVRKNVIAELSADSANGRARRVRLQSAVTGTSREFHAVGVEMNQRYNSQAVFQEDQGPRPDFMKDPVLYYQPNTYPGSRLPHAWLNTAIPSKLTSTIDLAGKGGFTLFTGIGGAAWKPAATKASETLSISVRVFSIGFRQDYEDAYFDWTRLRGVEESGCVLARPDRFVAWRCNEVVSNCDDLLLSVMKKILSL